ncbi:uncharacterized protein LOC120840287 [Ixodes scapularis]|uniref:uncharacterized protein LOC120840287 n=1 Tax=Ixodes scapularis TaxID=6945 RepID=UPI001C38B713|nr:uncharacterized protein LOC120840287 [Ixodes scapularis]
MSMLFSVVQVLLTAAYATTSPGHLRGHFFNCDGLWIVPASDSTTIPVAPTIKSPRLAYNVYGVWQPGTSLNSYLDAWLLKLVSRGGQLGHGIALETTMSILFSVVQVGYVPNSHCHRSNDSCFIAVSCPHDVSECRRRLFMLLAQSAHAVYLALLALQLSGDIETNPGPDSVDSQVANILSIVTRIEIGQSHMFTEIKKLQDAQSSTDVAIKNLKEKVAAIEADLSSMRTASDGSGSSTEFSNKIALELSEVNARCDDAEYRLRRLNLLFFGIPDLQNETWIQSEATILSFCEQRLGIKLDPNDLERSHRLGKFLPNKNRPIIVKFLRYKDRQNILSLGFKLKDSVYAIREDLSDAVRTARNKLYLFAQSQNETFKIRYDKLHMNNKCYKYDVSSDSVIEVSR